MTDTKISEAYADNPITVPLATDMFPLARVGDLTAYAIRQGQFLSNSPSVSFVNRHTFLPGVSIGVHGATLANPLTIYAHDVADWNMALSRGSFFGGAPDDILFFGWNVGPVGVGKPVAGEASLYIGFEHDFWTDAVNHYSEWYVEFVSENGLVSSRPFQTSINRATNLATTFLNGGLRFGSTAGVVHSQTDESGNWTFAASIINFTAVGGITLGSSGNVNIAWRANNATYFLLYPDADEMRVYKNMRFFKGSAMVLGTGDAFNLQLVRNGSTVIELGAAAIALYGVTPVARQLLATGVGATVDNVITALQNLGAVRQS